MDPHNYLRVKQCVPFALFIVKFKFSVKITTTFDDLIYNRYINLIMN